MSSQNATLSAAKARQLLNLAADADAAGLAQAYRSAVKAAHPDRPGGDAERLRQVIEAHRLLKTLADSPLSFAPALNVITPPHTVNPKIRENRLLGGRL